MLAIRLNTAFSDTSLPELAADDVLVGSNNGVKFLFDFARSDCWTGTPTDAATITDIASVGNAEWEIESGATQSITGNGLDLTSNGSSYTSCIYLPASLSSSLYGGGTSDQYWMVCLYVKLPTSGNWWSSATIGSLMKFAATDYTAGAEHFMLNVSNAPALQLRRGISSGTIETISMTGANLTPHQGQVTQILAYRTSGGTFLRLKSSGGTTSGTLAAAANNNQNFSALRGQIGSGLGTWTLYGAGAPRIYRGWIEDLDVSGRTATTVADADYTRTIARAVFT